jgi:excisionase family DNA binding protein
MEFADGASSQDDAGDEVFYTVAEAAARAGVSRQTVHDWIRRGHLTAIRTDDEAIRVSGAALDRMVDLRKVAASSHLRLETMRQWTEGAADDATAGSP